MASERCRDPALCPYLLSGSDLPSFEVQHHIRHQNRCRARQPLGAPQNVRWSPQSQQELPFAHYQGIAGVHAAVCSSCCGLPRSLILKVNVFFTVACFLCCWFFHAVAVDLINHVEIAENCKSSRKPHPLLCQGAHQHFLLEKAVGGFLGGALIPTNLFKADPSLGLCRSPEGPVSSDVLSETLTCLSGGRVWGARDPGDRGALPGLCDARSAQDVFGD